jgi:hypothetical protein
MITVLLAIAVAGAQGPAAQSALPPAIAKAFQQSYPAATITATAQERINNRPAYRVESLDKGRRRIVKYDTSGGVIEAAEQIPEKELPAPVAAAMHSHRRAIYVSGMKVARNGEVRYELTVRGSRKTKMVAKPDGTVLSFQ